MPYYHSRALGELLVQLGLVPKNARCLEFHVPADGALVLRYEVLVDRELLEAIGQSLLQIAQESRRPASER